MKLLAECILCGSTELKPHSMRFRSGYPHISRVKCAACSAIFANPIAEQRELIEFYQNYYDKGNFGLIDFKATHKKRFKELNEVNQELHKKEFNYVLKHKSSGEFLDIGFGLGEPLFLAHKLGFRVYGTEFDADSIKFISEYIPKGTWFEGDLLDSNFNQDFFDFIRFWHVIEHVLSPTDYIKKIRSILKPGGVLMIGTPNIASNGYRIYRFLKFFSLSIPAIVDGMEHTILFNKKTLAKLLQDEGFEIVDHYTHSNIENYKKLLFGDLPAWKKVVGLLQSIFHVNQTIYAKKVE